MTHRPLHYREIEQREGERAASAERFERMRHYGPSLGAGPVCEPIPFEPAEAKRILCHCCQRWFVLQLCARELAGAARCCPFCGSDRDLEEAK